MEQPNKETAPAEILLTVARYRRLERMFAELQKAEEAITQLRAIQRGLEMGVHATIQTILEAEGVPERVGYTLTERRDALRLCKDGEAGITR